MVKNSLLLVAFLLQVIEPAAADRGAVAGRVIDLAGSPLAGVSITLAGPETRRALTDPRGEYAFASLRPGQYQLRFARAGFTAATAAAVVRAGATAQLETRMAKLPSASAPPVSTAMESSVKRESISIAVGRSAAAPPPAPIDPVIQRGPPFNTEAYDHLEENPFRRVAIDPLSTFSIDVDTASYANVRRFLNDRRAAAGRTRSASRR